MLILISPQSNSVISSPRATGVTLMGRRMRLATTGDTVGLGQHIRQQRGGVARGQGAWILLSGPGITKVRSDKRLSTIQ